MYQDASEHTHHAYIHSPSGQPIWFCIAAKSSGHNVFKALDGRMWEPYLTSVGAAYTGQGADLTGMRSNPAELSSGSASPVFSPLLRPESGGLTRGCTSDL